MPGEVVLTGELGLLSLFDLGQLLMLNGATGQMTVTTDGRRGYLYFVRGQIVNAVDDEYQEGDGAAYRVFSWRSGTFEFRPQSPTDSRAITDSTEGLMMEAARRMDESGAGEAGGTADRLARRASSLDALRQAFDSVASQARPGSEAGAPDSSPFESLKSSTDVLLLRPDDVPRVRIAGRWRAAGAQPLETTAFEQLRQRLLDGSHGEVPEGGVRTWIANHDDGRRYEITLLGGAAEALWVRAAGLAPLAASQLHGPAEAWQAALAAPAGLLLVCGADAEAADRLLHACVAQLLRERAGTVLLAAEQGRWQHSDEHGALLWVAGAEAMAALRAVTPEVAAFDHAHAAASAEALLGAARVVAAVVAPNPAAALTRWCAHVGRRCGDGIETLLASAPVDVVSVAGEPGAEGRVPFGVAQFAFDPAAPAAAPTFRPVEAPAAVVTVAAAAPTPRGKPKPRTQEAGATPSSPPTDPMAELAAELTRSLKKAA